MFRLCAQLWEQIELRASKVDGLVSQLMSGGQEAAAAIIAPEEMDVDEADSTGLANEGQDPSDDSDYNEFGEEGPQDEDDEEDLPSDAETSFTILNDIKRSPARAKRLALEQLDEGSACVSSVDVLFILLILLIDQPHREGAQRWTMIFSRLMPFCATLSKARSKCDEQ